MKKEASNLVLRIFLEARLLEYGYTYLQQPGHPRTPKGSVVFQQRDQKRSWFASSEAPRTADLVLSMS